MNQFLFDDISHGMTISESVLKSMHFDANLICKATSLSLLVTACGSGNYAAAEALIQRGASLEWNSEWGLTAFLAACHGGYSRIVRLLIDRQANCQAVTRLGATGLHLAAASGSTETVEILLREGLDPNGQTVELRSPLDTGAHHLSPLMVACFHGHVQVAERLMRASADVNLASPVTGLTALMLAAIGGQVDAARLLIERFGANPNLTDVNHRTALDLAVLRNRREAESYLLGKTRRRPLVEQNTSLTVHEVAKLGQLPKLKTLLATDPRLANTVSSQDGSTPLMCAAIGGHAGAIELLVEHSAEINAQMAETGWTALMQAVVHRQREAALRLVQLGADVRAKSHDGLTALDMLTLLQAGSSADLLDQPLLDMLAERIASPALRHTLPTICIESKQPSWFSKVTSRLKAKVSGSGKRSKIATSQKENVASGDVTRSSVYEPALRELEKIPEERALTATAPQFPAAPKFDSTPSLSMRRSQATGRAAHNKITPLDTTKLCPPTKFSLKSPSPTPTLTPTPTGGRFNFSFGAASNEPSPTRKVLVHPVPRSSTFAADCSSPGHLAKPLPVGNGRHLRAVADVDHDAAVLASHLLFQRRPPLDCPSIRGAESSSSSTLKSRTCSSSESGDSDITPQPSLSDAPADLAAVLRNLKLERYGGVFENQQIDLETFLTMGDADLRELGVGSREARLLMLSTIDRLSRTEIAN